MNNSDELVHLISHVARMSSADQRSVFFGRISDYDPTTHIGRATLPVFGVADLESGNIVDYGETPWLPVATIGIGAQWAPKINDQCLVLVTESGTGPGQIVAISYSDAQPAFYQDLAQGEFGFYQRDSKTNVRYNTDGSRTFTGQKGLTIVEDPNGGWTVTGINNAVLQVDKNGQVFAQTKDGKTITMPATGSLTITGPEGGSGAATVVLDTTGNIILTPGAGGTIQLG